MDNKTDARESVSATCKPCSAQEWNNENWKKFRVYDSAGACEYTDRAAMLEAYALHCTAALQAENAKLRKALEAFVNSLKPTHNSIMVDHAELIAACSDAEKALAEVRQ